MGCVDKCHKDLAKALQETALTMMVRFLRPFPFISTWVTPRVPPLATGLPTDADTSARDLQSQSGESALFSRKMSIHTLESAPTAWANSSRTLTSCAVIRAQSRGPAKST